MWDQLDLSTVHGFPLWDGEIAELTQIHFGELEQLFAVYRDRAVPPPHTSFATLSSPASPASPHSRACLTSRGGLGLGLAAHGDAAAPPCAMPADGWARLLKDCKLGGRSKPPGGELPLGFACFVAAVRCRLVAVRGEG